MKGYIEIVDVIGREVMDSRGNPTVEVEVYVEGDTGAYMGRDVYKRQDPPFRSPTRAQSALREAQSYFRARPTACRKPQIPSAVCTIRTDSLCSVR